MMLFAYMTLYWVAMAHQAHVGEWHVIGNQFEHWITDARNQVMHCKYNFSDGLMWCDKPQP